MDDELEFGKPQKKGEVLSEKPNLDTMSVEELRDYIVELEAEIERVQNMIASKVGPVFLLSVCAAYLPSPVDTLSIIDFVPRTSLPSFSIRIW